MQNLLITGLVLASIIGSGAAVGYGAGNVLGGMHPVMHGYMHGISRENCDHPAECDYSNEECEEHSGDDCINDHQECNQERGHMGHGC